MSESINSYNNNCNKPVFITQNTEMKNLLKKIKLVAQSKAPVLITGESGTGKEVVARLLHYFSKRRENPFIALNCGALPKDIVESELFGHEKGSFTGATETKKGCFEQADGGVLFLDEVAEMSPKVQVKLLRAVELKNFRRVGGTKEIETDVQIISATNQDVNKMMNNGDFREDLFYRVSVIELNIPPLRERREDIPLLSEFFLSKYNDEHQLPAKRFSKDLINRLMDYDWPGNVRELRNVIERCAIMCPDEIIDHEYLFRSNGNGENFQNKFSNGSSNVREHKYFKIPHGTSMKKAEQIIINRTLSLTDNNISEAARILGVSRNTLHNKLSKFNN